MRSPLSRTVHPANRFAGEEQQYLQAVSSASQADLPLQDLPDPYRKVNISFPRVRYRYSTWSNYIYRLWGRGMGLSLSLIVLLWATGWRFCRKTQKGPAKCVYCVRLLYTVYSFPHCGWNFCEIGRQFLSVLDNNKVWGKLYGLAECLIFHR